MITKEAIQAALNAYYGNDVEHGWMAREQMEAAITAAFAAMPVPAVKVKPLEWVLSWGPDEEGDECHVAGTPFGSFAVERLDGRWMWRYCFDEYYDEDHFECEGLEAGKVAAQALWNSRISPLIEASMLSASPYPTAWDDVRKYVEGLEREINLKADFIDATINQLASAEARLADLYGNEEKPRYTTRRLRMEVERAKASAEIRIAELEKRLADAERVIEPFARLGTMSTHIVNEDGTASFSFFRTADMNAFTDARRAARAYMEGK